MGKYCTFLQELLEEGLGLVGQAAEAEALSEVGTQHPEAQMLGRLPQVLLQILQPYTEQRQQWTGWGGGQLANISSYFSK